MLGNNIRILRKEKGLSQEELASRLHVVRQTVSKWEKGVSVPDADLLVRLSEILETPVATLLDSPIEQSTDTNIISQQLEQINATLAEKNRRSRLVWRIVGIILLAILLISVLLVVVGVVSLNDFTTTTTQHADALTLDIGKYELENPADTLLPVPYVQIDEDNQFQFVYSHFSSYLPTGYYDIQDGMATLRTSDGNNTYVFLIDGQNLVFQKEQSSNLQVFQDEQVIEDGAVFKYQGA